MPSTCRCEHASALADVCSELCPEWIASKWRWFGQSTSETWIKPRSINSVFAHTLQSNSEPLHNRSRSFGAYSARRISRGLREIYRCAGGQREICYEASSMSEPYRRPTQSAHSSSSPSFDTGGGRLLARFDCF